MDKRQLHTLRKNCCNCLNLNYLGAFITGMFIITLAIIYCTSITSFIGVDNVTELFSNMNIYILYLYFINTVSLFILIALYDFVLKKILLIKIFQKILPAEFRLKLINKINMKERFYYIFSLKFLKIYLLTSLLLLLPHILIYMYFDCFISLHSWVELVIYVLYISICFNFSYCYINRKKFFSIYNICNIAHSFILLLLAKTTVIYLMPLLLPCLIIINEYTDVYKHIDSVEKNTLKFLNKLPIVNKLVFIKIPSNYVFYNSSIAKFRYNNLCLQLNSNNVKHIAKTNLLALTMCNSKPISVIISAAQSAKTKSTCLMFTYSDRSSFIAIDRLSVVNIPSINTQTLRIDTLGFLPKSGYFNKSNINLVIKPKALDVSVLSSNDVFFKNTSYYKPLSESAIVEKGAYGFTVENKQEIPLSSDISDLLANLYKYNLDIKTNNYINNISPDLLNPTVFMMNFTNQSADDDDDEFNDDNNSNNKGKGKATDEEVRAWDEQDISNNSQLVQMEIDTDTSNLDVFQDEAWKNLMTPEELALQSSFMDFYNTIEDIDIDYEVLKIDLSIYQEGLMDISSSIDYFSSTGAQVHLDYLEVVPASLYRLSTDYPSFFDEDSGIRHNVIEGLTDLNNYITYERKAAVSEFMKNKASKTGDNTVNEGESSAKSHNTISSPESISSSESESESIITAKQTSKAEVASLDSNKPNSLWGRLYYSSNEQYQDAIKHRYDELCAGYYKDNRGDDINVKLLMDRAKRDVIDNRAQESAGKGISRTKQRNAISTRVSKEKDPKYWKDKDKIKNSKTLTAKDKEIQLEARTKLHIDILNKYKIRKKN